MLSAANEDFRVKFPLHSLVWENDYRKLENDSTKNDVEAVDPRGRTPLHLAVSLGHLESVRVLLRHGAEVTKENAKNWTVLQEAVSTGDPEMVQLVLQRRDYLKASTALGGVPELLSKIREVFSRPLSYSLCLLPSLKCFSLITKKTKNRKLMPLFNPPQSADFYMEMKWEFTSWIPLVSRVCPGDVCRIWKSGASLRVDATLLGFENMTWIRGRRSFIFRGDDTCTEFMEVNHDEEVVVTERFDISREIEDVTLDSMQPAEQEVAKRLTTPIVNTFLDTRDIAFERQDPNHTLSCFSIVNKSGILGWRSDKTEVVNGFEAKVFTVNNVNVVIRTRTEHLTDEEKARIKSERNVLEYLLGTVEQQISAQGDLTLEYATATNPTAITPQEYFDPAFDLEDRDIGRPIELTVTPIIDLMARTSTHFARLRDFVTLKFPPGFPVKIEIPLFHVLNARISFGSVNKCSTGDPSTATPEEGSCGEAAVPPLFQVCPSVFEVPSHYRHRGGGGSRHTAVSNHDEELLQYAIHQSLLESGGGALGQEVTWEDANGDLTDPIFSSQSDGSIPEGVLVDLGDTTSSQASSGTSASSPDADLRMAMELSARAQAEDERRRRKKEEEELERILQLSLTEK
ncbi:unnamed protein product [Coregonus sp. 'balchen']|nr:unnamed protein product [Coregonus sp. 'balchen']